MSTMVTVKRNGVYIVFPSKSKPPIKGGVFPVNTSITPKKLRTDTEQKSMGWNCFPAKSSIRKVRKRCMRCGDLNCFYGSSYCWDCYKYEHYESK